MLQLFVYVGRKEENVLFNDALNTFYLKKLQLFGIRHNIYDKGPFRLLERNPAATTWATLSICSKGSFICIIQ